MPPAESAGPQRFDLATARGHAATLVALLRPACEEIIICGSIRRGAPDQKDIELVARSKRRVTAIDLFGTQTSLPVLREHIDKLRAAGVIAPDTQLPRWGHKYLRLRFMELPVDLYVPDPQAFGLHVAIRTGPESFSKQLVTQRRWHGLLPNGWNVHDGLLHDEQGRALAVPDEATLFRLYEMQPIRPEDRQ